MRWARAKARARPGRQPRRTLKWVSAPTTSRARARRPRLRFSPPCSPRLPSPTTSSRRLIERLLVRVTPAPGSGCGRELRDRHAQAAREGMLGAVVRMLGPGKIAEPTGRAMQPARILVEIGEGRRHPALQAVAVIAAAAQIPRDPDTGRDERTDTRIRWQQTLGVALAQPRRREDDAIRPAA